MVSFSMQKPLSLIRVQLFIFAFVSFAWGDRSKKISLWFMSDYFAYIFFLEFCVFRSYISVSNPLWLYFCIQYNKMF